MRGFKNLLSTFCTVVLWAWSLSRDTGWSGYQKTKKVAGRTALVYWTALLWHAETWSFSWPERGQIMMENEWTHWCNPNSICSWHLSEAGSLGILLAAVSRQCPKKPVNSAASPWGNNLSCLIPGSLESQRRPRVTVQGEPMFPPFLCITFFPISYLIAAIRASKSNHAPYFSGGNCLQDYFGTEVLGYSSALNAPKLELGASPSSRTDVFPARTSNW